MKIKKLALYIAFIMVILALVSVKEEPLRLHIIANSNSSIDQNIKLLVRDEVLDFVGGRRAHTKEEAELFVFENMTKLEERINAFLLKKGADYTGRVQTGRFMFPERSYGSVSYKAGEYSAVRVILGDGAGENWWCVVFPPLCITSEENTSGEYSWAIVELIKEILGIETA